MEETTTPQELETEVIAPQEPTGEEIKEEEIKEPEKTEETATTPPEEKTEEVKNETFLGTYKSKEEAEKGLQEKDRYIEQLKAEKLEKEKALAETMQKMGFENTQQFQTAQVEQALSQQYQNDVATIEQAYQKELQQLNNLDISEIEYNQSLAYIEDLKVKALANSLANDRLRRHEFAQQQAQLTKQQFEAQKNAQYEQYKEHKDIIDLFYDGQPTIQKAIALKEAIGQKAVEAYKASLQANQENNNAISQMNSAVNGGQSVNDNAIPTTWDEVVNKMDADPKWYTKNQAKILEMKGQGLIK